MPPTNKRQLYRYGICQNIRMQDTGEPCPFCKSKQVQKLLVTKEFVCEHCGMKLHEVPRPKTFWEKHGKKIIAVAVLLAAAGIVLLCVKGCGGQKGTEGLLPSPPSARLTLLGDTAVTLEVGQTDTLHVRLAQEADTALIEVLPGRAGIVTANGTVVTAVKAGTGMVRVMLKGDSTTIRFRHYTVKEKAASLPQEDTVKVETETQENAKGQGGGTGKDPQTKDGGTGGGTGQKTKVDPGPTPPSPSAKPSVPYGTYSGPANGLNGKIAVTKHAVIDLKKADGRKLEVNPGDVISETKFRDGKLVHGKLERVNGDNTEINIGR